MIRSYFRFLTSVEAETPTGIYGWAKNLVEPLQRFKLFELMDVPLMGNEEKLIRVKPDASGYEYIDPPVGGAGAWGFITGDIATQADLQAELAERALLLGGNTFDGDQHMLDNLDVDGSIQADTLSMITDSVYGAGWNGQKFAASRDSIYDKINGGLVAAELAANSGGAASQFLCADGTWKAPSGFTNWTTIHNAVIGSPTANIDLDVTPYNEVIVMLRSVTAAASSFRGVVVSVDGGASFYSGATDYFQMNDDGQEATTFIPLSISTASAAARSCTGQITLLRENNIPKPLQNYSRSGLTRYLSSALSLAPITHIRICSLVSAGTYSNLTGGTVIVKGR